jgi:hypothetical protein
VLCYAIRHTPYTILTIHYTHKALCAAAAECGGFYFVNFDASPADSWNGTFTFRRSNFGLYDEGEVGMNPAPIPFPGQPGDDRNGCYNGYYN